MGCRKVVVDGCRKREGGLSDLGGEGAFPLVAGKEGGVSDLARKPFPWLQDCMIARMHDCMLA